MLCAGSSHDGKDVSTGDSGGPSVVPESNSDDTAVVIGISSFVTLNENRDLPKFPLYWTGVV